MILPRRTLLLCALVAAVAFTGCSGADGVAVSEGAAGAGGPAFQNVEPDAITIGVVTGGEALPLLVAEQSDLFEAAGVDARIVRFDTAGERDAALAAGEIDAFVGDLDSAATLEVAGTPVAVVALMADAALIRESTATPEPGFDPAAFGLGNASAYLVVSDHYLALPSGLLATRAVLKAADAAVVRIQGDPAAYQGVLADAAGSEDVVVAGGAYRAAANPGTAEVERQLMELSAAVTAGDLVLDIGR